MWIVEMLVEPEDQRRMVTELRLLGGIGIDVTGVRVPDEVAFLEPQTAADEALVGRRSRGAVEPNLWVRLPVDDAIDLSITQARHLEVRGFVTVAGTLATHR